MITITLFFIAIAIIVSFVVRIISSALMLIATIGIPIVIFVIYGLYELLHE